MDFEIDALLPWVDGDDPVLKAKRSQYMTEEARKNDDVAGATRYKSIGEIKYCVASLLRYAPFLRKIFIMTDGQDPGLTPFIEELFPGQSSKIEIIDHKVIFKGYEHALPVFNSNAIEAVFWNIPQMSEHILYFNDDLMLTAPVKPEDFFLPDGRVICYGSWFWTPFGKLVHALKPRHGGHKIIGFKDLMLNAVKLTGGSWRFINLGHSPKALLKSWFQNWAVERDDMVQLNITGKFREPFHFQTQEPYFLDLARKGKLVLIPAEKKSLYFKKRDAKDYVKRKLESFDRSDKPFACFNSLDYCTPEEQAMILAWLEKRICGRG